MKRLEDFCHTKLNVFSQTYLDFPFERPAAFHSEQLINDSTLSAERWSLRVCQTAAPCDSFLSRMI